MEGLVGFVDVGGGAFGAGFVGGGVPVRVRFGLEEEEFAVQGGEVDGEGAGGGGPRGRVRGKRS